MSGYLDRAQVVIDEYVTFSGPYYQEPDQTVIEDIVADLRHWAESRGVDWTKVVDMAELHFEEEYEGDQDSLGG